MKILVCGGRDFAETRRNASEAENIKQAGLATWAYGVLDGIRAFSGGFHLINGDCPTGADRLANEWASMRGVTVTKYPADWNKYDRAAGPIRNKLMLDENPDIKFVIAFPGGNGTKNMTELARERKIPVINFRVSK